MVGVDIGGTFTDCVVVNDQGEMVVGKSLSTPPDYSAGAADAVRDAARNIGLGDEESLLRQTTLFFHACTIGENTLITRSGPRTGLVATRGFPDTLLMMRGKVTDGLTEAEAQAHLDEHAEELRDEIVDDLFTMGVCTHCEAVVPVFGDYHPYSPAGSLVCEECLSVDGDEPAAPAILHP